MLRIKITLYLFIVSLMFTITACDRSANTPPGMVRIPGGTNSGTNPAVSGSTYDQHYPETYSLTVSTFYMDKYEVTKALWDVVYNWAVTNGYSFENAGLGKAPDHPVHTVNWYDCVKWCNARSEKEGRTPCYPIYTNNNLAFKTGQYPPVCNFSANGYRLPNNDEWEYAARGGLSGKRFPWGNRMDHTQANYFSLWTNSTTSICSVDDGYQGHDRRYNTGSPPYTSPVGSFAANGYGLYDMAGNVWEWTNDEFDSWEIIRGGSWFYSSCYLRTGFKYQCGSFTAHDDVGFRTVCR